MGIFTVDDHYLHLTMCPRNRDDFGLRWVTNKKNCACPPAWAPHKSTARKGVRGITLDQSRVLYELTSTVVPVGSRM